MSEKNILIVAAERGLGLGLSRQFLERGWNVVGTARPGTDRSALQALGADAPARLGIETIDVTDAAAIEPFLSALGERRFDVIFLNAGIYGPLHQSVLEATEAEMAEIMLTNTFGPIRLARRLLGSLAEPGTLCFMSSHRASIGGNVEGGLELYRASKAGLNMLSRGIYADIKDKGHTVLNIHPGWAATSMGTLDGTVPAEISVEESVQGVADVVEKHQGSNQQIFVDYQNQSLDW